MKCNEIYILKTLYIYYTFIKFLIKYNKLYINNKI